MGTNKVRIRFDADSWLLRYLNPAIPYQTDRHAARDSPSFVSDRLAQRNQRSACHGPHEPVSPVVPVCRAVLASSTSGTYPPDLTTMGSLRPASPLRLASSPEYRLCVGHCGPRCPAPSRPTPKSYFTSRSSKRTATCNPSSSRAARRQAPIKHVHGCRPEITHRLRVMHTVKDECGCTQHTTIIAEPRGHNPESLVCPGTNKLRQLFR
jgi:hypothetical protein